MLTHEVEKSPKGQSGFTLIELLIVIAIIAILAAIAIPMFMKYKQGAYLDSVRSDVKNTVTAIESYAATNGAYPTSTADTTYGPGPGTGNFTAGSFTTGTNLSSGDINVSSGNTIKITDETSECANGYMVEGFSANIKSGPGSSATHVTYDSCTGKYSGF